MITTIKILIILAIILVLSYPFIPMKGKLEKLSVASRLKFKSPHNRKNLFFVLLAAILFAVVVFIFDLFDGLAQFLVSIPILGRLFVNLINSLNSQIDYILLTVKIVLINLVILYAFIFAKAFVKVAILNPLFGLTKKRGKLLGKKKGEKNQTNEEDQTAGDGDKAEADEKEEKNRKRRRIPDFIHSIVNNDEKKTGEKKKEDGEPSDAEGEEKKEKKAEYGPVASWILGLFFEGDEFQYSRPWAMRVRMILQLFIRLVQALYLLFLLTLLVSVFFPLPRFLYDLLVNILHVGDWYIYPVISMLFLQEICNVFETPIPEEQSKESKKEEKKKKEERKIEARLRALLSELKRRFDAEHALRYYPEVPFTDIPEYKCANVTYASSMDYIGKMMSNSSGRVVQSYMECLDAMYCDSHVYFAASFYSELGEYLIAYAYTRLLSGSRLIFVVPDADEKNTLRTYISDRLMHMTGGSAVATWRVYTADEHLDQADILIATPGEFASMNIVEQHPAFFEEVCNAIFIDADKAIHLDSYLCPIMATRLKKATNDQVRFAFLTLNLYKGFAEKNLPKFFCVDNVLSFSSAKENEAVSYVLWNKESKKGRIYNKSGQKLSCLESIIAEQAFQYGMDGVRLITEAPLGHSERQILALHEIEINKLFKKDVDVNYMVYSDDRCNLSAALYACTRFRGKKKSVVHILSKPYLLREYFMAKANTEDYINRSSFIQPRVSDHVENHKFSLLRIFCEVATDEGLPVGVFVSKMKDVMATQLELREPISSAFCRYMLQHNDIDSLKVNDFAAYLIAGLCDDHPLNTTPEEESGYLVSSIGNRAKDFYIITDPTKQNRFSLARDKKIIFSRTKEVLQCLLENNKRVELRLNDDVIGYLDTFPNRVSLEYIAGQSMVFDNSEYEIEHVAEDGRAVYLRHENISIKNCLDTVLLRHYRVNSIEALERSGVLNNSKAVLEEIRVTKCRASLVGTTYGFYSLTTDRQTLDFYKGVEGNPHSEYPNIRTLENAHVLRVALKARMECNDGMRLLMAAVFNEFIRTLFPQAYRCIAICPVLEKPFDFTGEDAEDTVLNRVKTLYPFILKPGEDMVETDPHNMQFLFINDCADDVGVLDWFYDRAARYMQEFLANVYSYLYWLRARPEKAHFIYFGGEALPECFDLDGCCELLQNFNLVLSDDGAKDFETASNDAIDEVVEYCAFCHKPMESGRVSFFDKHRFICADCFETVDDISVLQELQASVRRYLGKQYREYQFGKADVKFDPVYDLTLEQILSEFNMRVDYTSRTIFVEIDNPVNNVRVAILRGLIALWQSDKSLSNHYALAQLYFEELKYWREMGENVTADWIYDHLPDELRAQVDEITDYVNFKDLVPEEEKEEEKEKEKDTGKDESNTEDSKDSEEASDDEKKASDEASESNDTETDSKKDSEAKDAEEDEKDKEKKKDIEKKIPTNGERRTSFSFMRVKADEARKEEWDGTDPQDDDYSDDLYDPNKVPRFWKRYLLGKKLDDGEEEDVSDALNEEEDDAEETDTDKTDTDQNTEDGESDDMKEPNAPFPGDGTTVEEPDTPVEETDESEAEDDPSDTTGDGGAQDSPVDEKERKKEEKRRKKEEKKQQRAERRRQKQLEWEQQLDALEEEEKKKKQQFTGKSDGNSDQNDEDDGDKKGLFFWRKKSKKADESDNKDTVNDNDTSKDTPKDDDNHNNKNKKNSSDKKDLTDGKDADLDDTVSEDDVTDDNIVDDNVVDDNGKDKRTSNDTGDKGKRKSGKDKKSKKKRGFGKHASAGEKILPHEEEEKTNPQVRVYNDLVRAAYNYSEEPISTEGIETVDAVKVIYQAVKGDYPELFWIKSYNIEWYQHNKKPVTVSLVFRCKDANGRLDVKQINRKRAEMRKAAKTFTKGITSKTDPYQALLTIYRRLILTLDYDTVGLNARIDADDSRDDSLRSLYNALVHHKVVCAGYAAAMQYLLQSVGIVCGYVISEDDASGGCHAFNILKIGKYCYYLDATWGDHSNTGSANADSKNEVYYDYFCVPYSEFLMAPPEQAADHMPRKAFYPGLETFKYTNHEYYRYHHAYVKSYNEADIIKIFANAAVAYNEEEMGKFMVSFRCSDGKLAQHVGETLYANGKIHEVIAKAKAIAAKKNKKAVKPLEREFESRIINPDTGVVYFLFKTPSKKRK